MKYSDRGLVKNGVVSKLFDQLYMTLTGSLTLFFTGAFFNNHFSDKDTLFIKICKGENDQVKLIKSATVLLGLSVTMSVTTALLYYTAKKFALSKSQGGQRPPVIFGRYQRNVFTFFQTFIFNIIVMFLMTVQLLFMFVFNDSPDVPHLHDFILIHPLLIDFSFFMFPIFGLWNVWRNMPVTSGSSENQIVPESENTFYVRQPELLPRRYSQYEFSSLDNINNRNIIFVREME